jgi:mRNA-degrading endonuclease toxin of MazEF toxin-antitoxin module
MPEPGRIIQLDRDRVPLKHWGRPFVVVYKIKDGGYYAVPLSSSAGSNVLCVSVPADNLTRLTRDSLALCSKVSKITDHIIWSEHGRVTRETLSDIRRRVPKKPKTGVTK